MAQNTVKLENARLSVEVSLLGGSLCSIYDKERQLELMWPGDPQSWRFQDVVIFPLMGQPDGGYEAKGGTYSFELAHGVARHERFSVEESSDTRAVISLTSNANTLAHYPFEFCLTLTYTLLEKGYRLSYSVASVNGESVPFQIGAHAGFRTAGDSVELEFEGETPVKNFPFDGKLHESSKVLAADGRLRLSEALFDREMSLIIDSERLRGCTVTRGDGIKLRYDFGGAPRVTVWGFYKGSQFCCVEPWWGVCEGYSTPRDIFGKELINLTGPGEKEFSYSLCVD